MSMLNNSEDIDSYPIPPKNNDEYAELFDENNQNGEAKSLLSLIGDTLPRAPIDLIQADFPSTPSSIFGKHAAANGEAAANSAPPAVPAQANANLSLDQTTKSLEQMYVSSELSPKTTPPANSMSHYVVTAPNGQAAGGAQLGGPISKNFAANNKGGAGPNQGNVQAGYNSLLGNNSSQILNNGLNPLTPAVAMPGANAQAGGAQQQQQPYYMQQAMYLDQNGQPMYYRPVTNQFGQEFTYVTAADGSTHLAPAGAHMNADPAAMQSAMQQQQSAFMQFPPGTTMTPITNSQGMPTGYWTTAGGAGAGGAGVNEQQQQYMNGGHPHQGGMMDGQRRMVYNPATGQYNQIPAMGGQGGGNQGGRGSLQQGPHGGNNMGNMPALLPRNAMNNGGMNEIDSLYGMMDSRGGSYLDYVSRMNRERDNGFGSRDMRDLRRDNRDGGNGMRGDRGNDRNNRNANPPSNGVNPVRDSLVDDFRNTYGKSRQWGLRDLLGHVVAFCQDQHGSRFIQQRLEVCSDVDKQLIFDEIIPAAPSLMTDVFGNYVLQKLFEYGTPDQCESLALLLKGQAVQLAMQMYGCRVVQKALEYVNTPRLIELVSEFESPPLLLRCVHDSNGNHVIQKCIEIVSRVAKEAATPEAAEYLSSRIQFIIDAFRGKVKELSSHPYGCRVVQRILEHCSNNQKAVILEELRQCCTELVQDCYGNYVIQFVMQHGWEADRQVLIREVQANLLEFSQHKFASNVVEKCLQFASKKDRDEMIWTIINVTFDLKNPVDAKGHCVLESMVRDPYANYVVQKVIDVSDERQRAAIMRYVKENITQLRRYTYGKHIIVRLEKITNEKF